MKKSQQEHKVKNDKEKIVKPISQSKPIIEQKAINQQNQQSQTIPFTQQTQQTSGGFGDISTIEQNSTTPSVQQSNITEKTSKTEQKTNITPPKQTDNTSVMSKAISSSFPGINIMKIENCQNNGNTTPKPSLLNIPTDKTQDTSRSQSAPSGNH